MEIGLGGLTIGHLRQVVILYRLDCTSLECLWEHATTKKLKDLGIALTLVDSIKSIKEQHVCSGGRTE